MSEPADVAPIDLRVEAARRGDRAATEALLRDEYPRIAALCRRLCAHPEDAADATQEAMIAVVRGLPRFDGRSAIGTWVYRVATNACLDELRRVRRRPVAGGSSEDLLPVGGQVEPDTATRLDIEAALSRLPLDFRAAVVLRDLCGLDYDEIASVLEIAPGTVRSRIARGRANLAELLGNQNHAADVELNEQT